MIDPPIVSVIIAVYNAEPYLDECLESLVAQTFDDWEVVACDDASTDQSWLKLQRWTRQDSRIRAVRNDFNQGPAATRNRALDLCRGTFIAIQDADDLSFPERLRSQVGYLEVHPECAFVGTGLTLFDEHGEYGRRIPSPAPPRSRDYLTGIPFCHATTLFRREALEAVGGYRIAWETRRGQDYDLFMRLHAGGFQGHNIPLCLYRYREGQAAYQRRKFRYRIGEMIVRYKGFKKLDLLPWAFPFVLKPILAGLLVRRPRKWVAKKEPETVTTGETLPNSSMAAKQ